MKKQVNEGLSSIGVLCVLIGMSAACGGASSAQGSDPAKTSAAPAASGGAAPAGSAAGKGPGMEEIKALLKEHSRELKVCFERDKDRGMIYKGETKFRVKVDNSGKVTDIQGVDTPPAGEFLSACVSEKMKDWKFPPVSGGGLLNFPINW